MCIHIQPLLSLQAKDAYNKFYFRYPNGESRADVVQRATLFTSKLFRSVHFPTTFDVYYTHTRTYHHMSNIASHTRTYISHHEQHCTRSSVSVDSIFLRGSRQHHIVFLHGVTQRALRCSLANLTVHWFESEPNPPNGSVLVMRRNSDRDTGQRWSEQW